MGSSTDVRTTRPEWRTLGMSGRHYRRRSQPAGHEASDPAAGQISAIRAERQGVEAPPHEPEQGTCQAMHRGCEHR